MVTKTPLFHHKAELLGIKNMIRGLERHNGT